MFWESRVRVSSGHLCILMHKHRPNRQVRQLSALLTERIKEKTMDKKYNKNLVNNAKVLRKNMTKEERHLWYDFLKDYPVKFYRQKVMGKYIVDFYCSKADLVIELDGSQHFEENGIQYDSQRDEYLKSYGLDILRIPNNEINTNFDGVCEYLDKLIKSRI